MPNDPCSQTRSIPELGAVGDDPLGDRGRGRDDDAVHASVDRLQVVVAAVALDRVGVRVDREGAVAALTQPPVDDVRGLPRARVARHAGDSNALLVEKLVGRLLERVITPPSHLS